MELEKVREAAERVAARWALRYLTSNGRLGSSACCEYILTGCRARRIPRVGCHHKDCERVSEQLSVILDMEDLVPGPAMCWSEFAGAGPEIDQAGGLRALRGTAGENLVERAGGKAEVFGRPAGGNYRMEG